MSFLTGTSAELLYTSIGPGTALATFTTEDNLQKTLPPVIIPAGFFYNAGATGKALKVKAHGRLSTTSAPTFTWSIRLLTSTTWSAAGIVWAGSALTAGTTVTNTFWELDFDMVFRTLAAGAASTVAGMGHVRSGLALASPFSGSIPAAAGTINPATYDNSISNYLFLSAACGTSSGSNSIQLEMLKVYGEN